MNFITYVLSSVCYVKRGLLMKTNLFESSVKSTLNYTCVKFKCDYGSLARDCYRFSCNTAVWEGTAFFQRHLSILSLVSRRAKRGCIARISAKNNKKNKSAPK